MKKQITTALLLALSLLMTGFLSNSVLAEQKHEGMSSKTMSSSEVNPTDHMAEIFNHYFAMRELLAQDKVDQLADHAKEMSTQLGSLIQALQTIRDKADNLKADNLEEARKGFAPLSESVLSLSRTSVFLENFIVFTAR
jgi:peptidoglycan hydrolase CwlO-like protein